MNFRFRTTYRLRGLQSIPIDPWMVVDTAAMATLAREFSQWLNSVGFADVSLTAFVSADPVIFQEIDARQAIANAHLKKVFFNQPTTLLESIAEFRAKRAADGSDPWLVVDVTGDDTTFCFDGSPEIHPDLGVSHHRNQHASSLVALNKSDLTDLHYRVLGALRVAAGHPFEAVFSAKGAWYLRADGRPHFETSGSISAKGHVSAPLRDHADAKVEGLLAASLRNPRIALALTAYGRSLDERVDEALGFLAAFTALELLVKEEQRKRVQKLSAPKEGLRDWFRTTAHGDEHDCAKFAELYKQRNGIAHSARFDTPASDLVGELFEKYMTVSPLLVPNDRT
jgi:hypothetical protein